MFCRKKPAKTTARLPVKRVIKRLVQDGRLPGTFCFGERATGDFGKTWHLLEIIPGEMITVNDAKGHPMKLEIRKKKPLCNADWEELITKPLDEEVMPTCPKCIEEMLKRLGHHEQT
jgi:hypothetical protein